MKKFLIIVLAILILAGTFQAFNTASVAKDDGRMLLSATGANLQLQDIMIRKNDASDQVNFRVRIKNIGTMPAKNLKNNLVVYLRVKNAKTGQWDELQKWSNIGTIKAGETISRDRLAKSVNVDVLSNKFTLQAEITLKNPGNIIISKGKIEGTYPVDSVKTP